MGSDATIGLQADIYGQVHPVETQKLLRKKLKEFDNVVQSRVQSNSDASFGLQQALIRCPKLLTKELKLIFLRSSVFNAYEAVNLFERYWNKRAEIFGPELAFAPLTLCSLLPDDRAALERGYFRLVPGGTDVKGRAIVYIDASLHDSNSYTNSSMCRVIFYFLHSVLCENEQAQKHGVIFMIDASKFRFCHWDRKFFAEAICSVLGSVPIRCSAFNIIRPPLIASHVIPVAKMFLSDILKKRVFCYSGSNKSILRRLEKYGITKDALPVELGGNIELNHIKWLEERQCKGL